MIKVPHSKYNGSPADRGQLFNRVSNAILDHYDANWGLRVSLNYLRCYLTVLGLGGEET